MKYFAFVICVAFGIANGASAQATEEPNPTEPDVVHLLLGPPGCQTEGNTNINIFRAILEYFENRPGEIWGSSSGISVLGRDGHYLLPESGFGNPGEVRDLLARPDEYRREVVASDLAVLVSPYEIAIQPQPSRTDWLAIIEERASPHDDFPDLLRSNARLVRFSASNERSVLSLELGGAAVPESPRDWPALEVWSAIIGVQASIRTADEENALFVVGRQIAAGPRMHADRERLRATLPEDRTLNLQIGFDSPGAPIDTYMDYCTRSMAKLGLDALVPHESDLALGPERLLELARASSLPFVAANLEDARERGESADHDLPFPTHRIVTMGERKVAIIGVLDRDQVERLAGTVRSAWRITDESIALSTTIETVREQLHRAPDLVVVLHATRGSNSADISSIPGVDVVLGHAFRYGLTERRTSTRVVGSPRGHTRFVDPLAVLESSDEELTLVTAVFEGRELVEVRGEHRPILADGPRDSELQAMLRALEEGTIADEHRVYLPDIDPFVQEDPSLRDLIWGERVLHRGRYRRYRPPLPARYTDGVWMRLVTNLMRDAFHADIALSRNLPRNSDFTGDIARFVVQSWLPANDSVVVVELTGAQLLRVAERMRLQEAPGEIETDQLLFAAGLDAKKNHVLGRPIEPNERYRVAMTDFVMAMPELSEALEGASAQEVPTMLLRDVVLQSIERWSDETGGFHPSHSSDLADALRDKSNVIEPRWQLRFDELSTRISVYETAHTGNLESTGEARVSTPDNYNISAKWNVGFLYDGPRFIWENRVRGAFDRMVFEDVDAQEQNDDLLATSEVQFRSIEWKVGEGGIALLPFLRAAFDTELTPDPSGEVPHQKLGRGSMGLVLRPGDYFKEVRLGAILQYDFRPGNRYDFGLEAGYVLELDVAGPVKWKSELSLRYLFPDGNDNDVDLGFTLSAVNRIGVDVARGFGFFVFGDLYVARGKVAATNDFGASIITGAGLDFSRVFSL